MKHDTDMVKRAFTMRRRIANYGTAKNDYMDSGLWEFLSYVRTFDEHDSACPIKPLPMQDKQIKDYILHTFHALLREDTLAISKSRQIMVSWILAAFGVWVARTAPKRKIVWQSFKEDEAANMVCLGKDDPHSARMSFIELNLTNPNGSLATWLIDPRIASGKGMSFNRLLYSNNSIIEGIPQGGGQVRSKVPTVFFSDESAFQDQYDASMTAALQCAQKIVCVSSANPGAFGDLVCGYDGFAEKMDPPYHLYPENEKLPKGMHFWKNGDFSILDIGYESDPDKDPERNGKEWYDIMTARNGGADSVKWQQEMERNYRVAGGSAVFPFAQRKDVAIFVPDKPDEPGDWYGAGFDYGIRDMSYLVVWKVGKDMVPYAKWEYGATGDNAFYKKFVADVARKCPYWNQIQGKIVADGTLWNNDQQGATGIRTRASLIEEEIRVWGGSGLIKGNKGNPSADVRIANMFLGDYWADPMKPKAFITTNCPLLWESIQNGRWEDHATNRGKVSNAPILKIKHKGMDPWDATSYLFDKLRPFFGQEKHEVRKGTAEYVLRQVRAKAAREQRARRRPNLGYRG